MTTYTPPLDDIRFVLNQVLNAPQQTKDIPEYKDATWDVISDMLDAVGKYARDVAHPLNKSGDEEGCTYDPKTKSVKTPKGFKDAYDQYVEMGLTGLSGDPEYGGFGLPQYLNAAISEMLTAANFSLACYPGLTAGAAKTIKAFGNKELKDRFLEKMQNGEWTGTMCLTEPQAGSDLGLIKTRAVPEKDGSFAITGNKIFITGGDNDLGGNIVHLVLARLPGAPEGVRGISLFAVPKFVPDANGNAGDRNPAFCTGIEHKMGINASATCSMSFEGAKGWLVGEPNKGMKAMFTMMNDARLKVGIQGLGLSEIAWQNAALYAADRVQGKTLREATKDGAKSAPIIKHANVRKHLMDMKCQIDAYRALALDTAIKLDLAEKHPEPTVRHEAAEYASLMTPVIKAALSDLSCAVAQKSVQLHGGSGFINETGVNQFYRDSLIGTIYEGTNDIQAMDFTFRKVLDFNDHMNRLGLFMAPLSDEIENAKKNPATAAMAATMEEGLKSFQTATRTMMQLGMTNKLDDIHTQAEHYMTLFGRLAAGRMWLQMVKAAEDGIAESASNEGAKNFYKTKIALADHYFVHIMRPDMKRLEAAIDAGAAFLRAVKPEDQVPANDLGIARDARKPDNNADKPRFTL